ncbi:hypothetical protein ACFL6U_10150 [Planctomycetota bacterium]
MICLYSGFGCKDALPYYYDAIQPDGDGRVPAEILRHISKCEQCQTQIGRLDHLLNEATEAGQTEMPTRSSLIGGLLGLHFEYVQHEVTCRIARPFLPSLVDETFSVHIATPITVHVDACEACRRDLKILSSLGLASGQLFRLGQFYTNPVANVDVPVDVFERFAEAVAQMRFSDLSKEPLRNMYTCKGFRDRVYQLRAQRLALLERDKSESTCEICKDLTAQDLFAYGFPYGSDPEALCESYKMPCIAHMQSCTFCLSKIQELHAQLCNVAERDDSEVVTVLQLDDKDTRLPGDDESSFQKTQEEHHRPRVFSAWIKAVAAVVVLVVGLILLTHSPQAVAVHYNAMQKSLYSVPGVHMVRWNAEGTTVRQEIWLAPTQQRSLVVQDGETIFRDVESRQITMIGSEGEVPKTEALSLSATEITKASILSFYGLLPEAGSYPAGTQWKLLEQPSNADPAGTLEVRELLWPQTISDGVNLWHRAVYYLDSATNLPQRIELYRQALEGDAFEKRSIVTLTYPAAGEMIDQFDLFQSKLVKTQRPDMP